MEFDSATKKQGKTLDRIRRKANLAWSKASRPQRIDALFFASREVERLFNFLGEKSDPNQKLEWPRKGSGVPDVPGAATIPDAVKSATAFIAMAYTAGFRPDDDDPIVASAMITNLLITLDGLYDEANPLKIRTRF